MPLTRRSQTSHRQVIFMRYTHDFCKQHRTIGVTEKEEKHKPRSEQKHVS